jgi:protein-S-isoprenylcysteine O-methyltransferase Ste14
MKEPNMSAPTRSRFAPLIAATGIALMCGAAAYAAFVRSGVFQWLAPAVGVAYVLWVLSEWRITTSDASQDARTDGYTCEAYASARFLTMLAAFVAEPVWQGVGAWLPVGAAVFAGGVALRAWAIVTLGRSYSHRVRTPAGMAPGGPGIVSHGPYRWLRHPAYTGMLVAHVGIAVLFCNVFVVAALCLALTPALVRRIRVEEQHLLSLPEYRAFAEPRARLAPGVW